MKKELRKLREVQAEYDKVAEEYVVALTPYEERGEELRRQLEDVMKASRDDPRVAMVATRESVAMDAVHEARANAELAALTYYDEYGFPSGKKTYIDEGCKVSVRDTTNRKVTLPDLMLVAAREDGVYQRVIKAIKPTLNRRNFNNWVDLKSPPGVEVSHDITVKVEVLSEPD